MDGDTTMKNPILENVPEGFVQFGNKCLWEVPEWIKKITKDREARYKWLMEINYKKQSSLKGKK
jgi:hypothetical protein